MQSQWNSDIPKNTSSSVLLLKYKNCQTKMWFSAWHSHWSSWQHIYVMLYHKVSTEASNKINFLKNMSKH